MADYMKKKNGELATWLNNYLTKLPTYGTAVGLSTADTAAQVTAAQQAHDAVELKEAKWNEYLSSVSDAQATIDGAVALIRRTVRRIKASPNFTDAIGADLGLIASGSPVDPAAIQPVLTADVAPGEVVLRFARNGADSVNLYTRRVGQTAWQLVSRATTSPFVDDTPLAQPNVPEQREYCARGLLGDTEVGQLSTAVTVVFAG